MAKDDIAPALKLISGGQTGADRAALDVALSLGLPCGGWCPAGRRAEDGPIAARYPLHETAEADPAARTRRNVEAADATLILSLGPLDAGTALTQTVAGDLGRPVRLVDLSGRGDTDCAATAAWLAANAVRVLNVAGPRESNAPGLYAAAVRFLTNLVTGRGAPA